MSREILVVDDDPLLCRLFATTLEKHGYTAHIAYSGPSALEFLKAQPVDLVVLDIMMADMDGVDVIAQIRRNPAYLRLPIVVLSARADFASRQRGLIAGATDYLVKPITPDDLLIYLQRLWPED
ncbi:MAG: response regulator [Anaerolineae bacterium]|nr:response regulator [Anaerolineae bacterium]